MKVDMTYWIIMNKDSKIYIAGHRGLVGSAILNNLKEKGIYKDGKRVGKWEFYLDGEIASDEEIKKKKTFTKKKQNKE